MNKSEAQKRIVSLRSAIDEYRYQYHVLDAASISDAALDSLKHELFQLEQEYPDLITPDSPTQRVGGTPLPKFGKVTHASRMLSMEDVFTPEELFDWGKRNQKLLPTSYNLPPEYFCMPKIDGLAVSLVYKDGILFSAATRGDGVIGEDVTQNIRTIESVPLKLRKPHRGTLEVRGEIYIATKDFETFNRSQKKKGEQELVNPRNGAAGSVRQLDPVITASRPLSFVAWDLVTDVGQKTQSEEWEILRDFGFRPTPDSVVAMSLSDIEKQWKHLQAKRKKMPFWIDGLVVRINDNELYSSLGIVGKTPRGLVAWKFPPEEATTQVLSVDWFVGRTGKLTPVANVAPTFVAGTTVTHATLHNADEIERLGLKVGDTVILTKAGDIIPKITSVLTKLRPKDAKAIRVPFKCPVCGSDVRRRDGEVDVICTNRSCFAMEMQGILYAVRAFDIMGMGEKIVERFVSLGLKKNAPDLFRLKKEDMVELEGFGEVSAEKIVVEIQSKKKIALFRFITALGIHNVGEQTARDLAAHFGSIDAIMGASKDQLMEVENIGEIVADSIVEFFAETKHCQLVEDYLSVGVEIEFAKKQTAGKLLGQTFVITGTLEKYGREEAQEKIRSLGGAIADSVSKKTSYVVVGDSPGSKAKKAADLGVPILSEEQFLRMVEVK